MYLYKRNNTYYLAINRDGKLIRRSLKTSLKSEALKNLNLFETEERPKPIIQITIEDFAHRYIDYCTKIYTEGYVRTIKDVMNHIKRSFPGRLISTFTQHNITDYINSIYSMHKHYAQHTLRTLKASFTKAVNWNLMRENVCMKVKLPKIPKPHPAFLSNKQLSKILENEPSQTLSTIYMIAFYSGMRISEILKLRSQDVDCSRKIISVIAEHAKSGKERQIPIAPILLKLLKPLRTDSPDSYLFTKLPGIRYRADYVSKRFKKACALAKIPSNIHFHSLRHSFASNLVIKGVSLYTVKELLGHADYATTQAYAHLEAKSLQVAVKLL